MTEYDYWKIFPRMPRKVTIGDITVRDGFQDIRQEPLPVFDHFFLVAGRARAALLAGVGHKHLVVAVGAPDASKAEVQVAAAKELADHVAE